MKIYKGIKRCFRKPKLMKEHIKKDGQVFSIVKTMNNNIIMNFSQNLSSKVFSMYIHLIAITLS